MEHERESAEVALDMIALGYGWLWTGWGND